MEFQSLFFVLVVFSSTVNASQANNCEDVEYITIDDARRTTNNSFNNSKSKLCDRSIIQDNYWYRFSSEAGVKIPTKKPEAGSCGTVVPIWMNGTHPNVSEGIVSRTACANAPHKLPLGCGYSYNIKVRNCGGFYIYQLKQPSNCYFAYCAGSTLPNCTDADAKEYCLENRPPHISMPNRFYVFENSKFQLFFNATDPEGYPMRYYGYLPNKTVHSVAIDDKRKTVTISVKKSGKVSLKVQDYEKLEDIHTIEFIAVRCPCENGGKCYIDNNKSIALTRVELDSFSCQCAAPYSGKSCEVSPCNELPCFPGVNCAAKDNSYTCETCPAEFEGDGRQCQLILTDDVVVVDAELTITSGLSWNNDLLDNNSFLYKQTTTRIVDKIIEAYAGTEEFSYAVVTGYRKGSVIVDYQLILKEELEDPLKVLRTTIKKNGNLAGFNVATDSVTLENTSVVDGELSVVSGLTWTDHLLDKTSRYYKSVTSAITVEITNVYANESEFLSAYVTGFRKKNFVVEFKLVWREKIEFPLEKLKNETKDGNLGTVKIDSGSVKIKTPSKPSDDKTYFGLHKTLFIVLVSLVSVLAVISIILCGVCIRKKHVSIVVLSVNEEQREIFPTRSNGDSSSEKKRPFRNQVIDLPAIESKAL